MKQGDVQLTDLSHSDRTELHFEEVLSAALSLSPGERAMLADHLLSSLDGPDQRKLTQPGLRKWKEESERLIKAKWN